MLIRLLSLLGLVLPFTVADVQFLAPAPGAIVAAGSPVTVTWQDSGATPPISSLAGYQIFLLVGGSTEATSQIVPASPAAIAGSHTAGASIAFTVPAAAGPAGDNAYFLKIISAPSSGSGQVINYSKRFKISGMTGVWPAPAIQEAYLAAAGSVDSVPATQNTVALGAGAGAGAGGAPGADGSFAVSYQFQTTGLTRYAPMQPRPGTKITATNTAPLFAPSPFTVATTFLPIPSLVTTVVQSGTYSVSSRENTASPAPMPLNDMQRFLNRWRD